MITVLSVVGTRPEAIKMAPVIWALEAQPDRIQSVVCATSQHRELLQQMLALFEIQPDFNLDVMQPDQALSDLTARLLTDLDAVLVKVQPTWVLAQGDTTSVLCASLATYYRGLRFGHVEAGLRTGDLTQPFPEEANRRVADMLAALLFAPTERCRQMLLSEGQRDERIRVTGNTVIDALQWVLRRPYDPAGGPLGWLPKNSRIVLVTAHRRESFGRPLKDVCLALRDLAIRFDSENVHFVFPVHPNRNVRNVVHGVIGDLRNLHLIEPLDYSALVYLMRRSTVILTDSGGLQEEGPGLGVPVLVLREATERPEGVDAGVARLIGTDPQRIVAEVTSLITDPKAHRAMAAGINPYGDGHAAERIVQALLEAE
jgi:UDP-N-acetylglucosamine 2-epimerase (non-hydrolysing)